MELGAASRGRRWSPAREVGGWQVDECSGPRSSSSDLRLGGMRGVRRRCPHGCLSSRSLSALCHRHISTLDVTERAERRLAAKAWAAAKESKADKGRYARFAGPMWHGARLAIDAAIVDQPSHTIRTVWHGHPSRSRHCRTQPDANSAKPTSTPNSKAPDVRGLSFSGLRSVGASTPKQPPSCASWHGTAQPASAEPLRAAARAGRVPVQR